MGCDNDRKNRFVGERKKTLQNDSGDAWEGWGVTYGANWLSE